MVEYLSGNRIQGSSTLTSSPSPTGWKLLKRSTAVGSGGTQTVDSGTFTAKDNLMILSHILMVIQVMVTTHKEQLNLIVQLEMNMVKHLVEVLNQVMVI